MDESAFTLCPSIYLTTNAFNSAVRKVSQKNHRFQKSYQSYQSSQNFGTSFHSSGKFCRIFSIQTPLPLNFFCKIMKPVSTSCNWRPVKQWGKTDRSHQPDEEHYHRSGNHQLLLITTFPMKHSHYVCKTCIHWSKNDSGTTTSNCKAVALS